MRLSLVFALCLSAFPLFAADPPETQAIVATVQKLFDAMASKDGAAIRSLTVPGMAITSLRANGQSSVTPIEKFADSIAAAQGTLLEHMWEPKVLVEGNIATLWAPYNFHRDGKFTHCGIDAFNLLKTAEGWKIGALSYTVVQQGCPTPK